jgi:biopolymer transport protein ExbB/TolQ
VRGPGPVVVYTSYRILIFFVTVVVLYAFGLRTWLLLLVAVLVSGLLSFVLLSRQRDAMSQAVVKRGASLRQRMQEATEAEDDADDAMRAAAEREPRAEPEPPSGQGKAEPDENREG